MSLKLHLTKDMTVAQMQPLWPGIEWCLGKYVKRFGEEETIENIISECAQGIRDLWVVTDGEEVILAAVTQIVTINATGLKRLVMAECGGKRYAECLTLLHEIEEWAKREHGADEATTLCRPGLVRFYEPYGFKTKAIAMSKRL